MRTDLHMISMLHHQLVGHISKSWMKPKFYFQKQSKIDRNSFNLYFSSSDSQFEVSDPENSSIMILSLVTICTMTWNVWLYVNQGISEYDSEYGFLKNHVLGIICVHNLGMSVWSNSNKFIQ